MSGVNRVCSVAIAVTTLLILVGAASAFTCPADCDCFVVGTDSRTYYSDFNLTLQFIKPDTAQFEFMVLAGDMEYVLVNKANYTDVELSGLQTYWCVGNHEMDVGDERNISNLNTSRSNVKYYYNDSLNTSYIVEYDKLYLVVLDEYIENSNGNIPVGSGLYNWLNAKLALLDKGKKIFVVGHEPAYPENAHIGNSLDQYPTDRDALWSMFDHHSVEAYFCGHTHYYSRNSSMLNVTQVDVGNMRWWGDGNSTLAYVAVNDTHATVHIYSNSTKGEVLDLIASYDVTNNYGADSRLLYHADNAASDSSDANDNWGTPRNGVDTQGNTGIANQGRIGHFDASNDEYVQVPTNDSLNFGTGNFTISAWFNTSGTGTIVEKSYDGYSSTGGPGWVLFMGDTGRLEFAMSDTPGGASTTVRTPSTTIYNDSQWHHVVISVGRGTNQVGWYVDGAHVETDDLGSRSGSISCDYDLWIGANYNKGAVIDREFDGDLDEIAIYNKTLNATEVSALYGSGNGYQHTGSEDELVSVWHMNEDTWVVFDSSGNGNNGTLTGGCYADGKHNSAFKLDGTDDYVFIPHSNSLDLTGKEMALEAWVKWDMNPGSGNSWAAIINKFGDNEWRLQHSSGNTHFEFAVGGGSVVSTSTIQEDVWYHVVGTYNNTNLLIYVNGTLENTASYSGAIPVSSSDVYIGRRTVGDRHFNGTIDEIAIYNRSLSAAEVLAHYNEFTPTGDGSGYVPPDPTTLANTTGNFWVNHTWSAGSGNITDSYNVSVNQTWHNATANAYWNNTGLSAHGWSNITVYAWNNSASGNLSAGNISQDTQIPNNAITITNTSGWSGTVGANVYVDYDATDLDSDTPTFSCNRTDLFTDFNTATGQGNWTSVTGTYYVDFGVSDGWQSTSNYTMTITASGTPLACTLGDICVNETGWWRDNSAFNASGTPIQAAADGAAAGDTVYVWNGSYTENVNIATAHLTLTGEGRDIVTVTAASPTDHVFEVQQDYVNISGFNATGASAGWNAGIYLGTGVDHCNIYANNASNSNSGIHMVSSSNNTLTENTANSNYYGIYLQDSCNDNNLTNNTANSNVESGIYLHNSSNNTLTENTANSNVETGIYLHNSSNNNFTNNTANSNGYGVYLQDSCNDNNLTNNTAYSNTYNGIWLRNSINNTLTSNNASHNRYGIFLISSSNHNTLTSNMACSNSKCGIWLSSSSNNNITSTNASDNSEHGIYLSSSSNNNTLTSNTADSNTDYGIYLRSSINNTLTSSNASDNRHGIYLSYSSNYTLTSNNASGNSQYGIHLHSSSNSTLTSNNASGNSQYGIYLASSSNNNITNNYFSNTNNALDSGNNVWNVTPYPGTNIIGGLWLGGNYWSDYAGVDQTGDGLGDTLTPYNTGITNGGDHHPLVQASSIYPPPDPTTLANTTGNFWVNHSWSAGSGNVTDSYNVSVNQTWHNGTTNAYWNNTGLSAHGWSNITVYAWNTSTGGSLSAGNISQDTQIPNNQITITNTSDWSGNEGANVYVDYDATDADSDTPTFSCNRTDLFTDFDTANGTGNWTAASGTYYVDFGVSDGWGSTSNYTMTITVAMGQRIPPDPTTLANTTGNFWVNHTWSAGSGNVTDSYNVSVNQTWHNGTTNAYWNNTGLSPHNWSNITVYAWNTSTGGSLSAGNVSQDTQIPNNNPSAGSPSPWNGETGVSTNPTLQVTVTDADTDNMNVSFYEQGGSQIGSTQTGIASGGTASVGWGGRSTSTTYHWYVVVNDTYNETTSTAWHFTTQSGGGPSHDVTIEDCNNRQTTEGGEIYNDFNYTNDDPDIPVFTTNATEGTLNSSTGVYNWTTSVGDAGVYVWWFRVDNAYGNHDDCTVTFTVTSSDVQPPTNLQHTTGNFWVRHSWTPGANTDSFNVSVNSAWHNSTTNAFWDNAGMSAHAWSNISIAGYNATTGNLSSFISEDTQVPNNPVTITNTSDWNGDTGENVYVDYDSTDADGDTPTYSCSRTDLFTDFDTATGTGNWTPGTNGTYYVDFGVSDGYGSTSNYTMTIRVGVSGGITTETKVPVPLFIALMVLMLCGVLYVFYAKTYISRIFTTLIATWMAFMLSQMIVSGNVVQTVSALNSADVWSHDTVPIQIPGLSYLLLFIGVILSIFLVKFVIDFGLAVIREAQKEGM